MQRQRIARSRITDRTHRRPTVRHGALIIALAATTLLGMAGPRQQAVPDSPAAMLEQARHLEVASGDLEGAMALYSEVLDARPAERQLTARALLGLGRCYEKLGDERALDVYRRLLAEFPELAAELGDLREHVDELERKAAPPTGSGLANLVIRRIDDKTAGHYGDTSGPAFEMFLGMPAPDGRHVSAIDWNTGNLAVYEVATGTYRALTSVFWPEFPLFSVFSPDSDRIAYQWYDRDALTGLRIIGLDGGDPREVGPQGLKYIQPEGWTEQGWLLATRYSDADRFQVVRVDVDSGATTVIVEPEPQAPGAAAVDLSGTRVAYEVVADEQRPWLHDIMLVDAAGGSTTRLGSQGANDANPVFTPDGRWLLFTSDRRGSSDLWAQRIDGIAAAGAPVLVHPGIGGILPMGITAKGVFYYSSSTQLADVLLWGHDEAGLVGEPEPATSARSWATLGWRWSPDGRRAAALFNTRPSVYPTNDYGRSLLILDREMGVSRTVDLRGLRRVRIEGWNADGRRLLAVVRDAEFEMAGQQIEWIDSVTGDRQLVRPGDPNDDGIRVRRAWVGPDPGWILYERRHFQEPFGMEIVQRQIVSGEERVVFRRELDPPPNPIQGWDRAELSPDGTRMLLHRIGPEDPGAEFRDILEYFEEGNPVIEVFEELDLETGEVQILWSFPHTEVGPVPVFDWYPDGDAAVVITLGARSPVKDEGASDEDAVVWRLPMDGGDPVEIARRSFGGHITGVEFHPAGESLALQVDAGRTEVWAIENVAAELDRIR